MPQLPHALLPEALRRVCDPNSLDFDLTATLPDLQEVLARREVAALEFGVSSIDRNLELGGRRIRVVGCWRAR